MASKSDQALHSSSGGGEFGGERCVFVEQSALLKTVIEAHLDARFTEVQGQVSRTHLFLEIQTRGYRGSRRR
ncbi:hypothetical protein ACIPSA_28145 [Streptomyces sp. NPDC086549]|uniref:hypothetical protein n=1 Tax=Streptomyces sp. NPDC086549 TaxID=3365752 RepID=UPI0037FFEC71